jgi:hypothetical protein
MNYQWTPKDLIPLCTAAAGYVVGILHTAAANFRERRKALNAVLFSLLEVRWEITASSSSAISGALKAILIENFGPQAAEELAKPEIRNFFRQLITSAVASGREGMMERYVEAVKILAPFYPLIAHRLSGERIMAVDKQLHEYYERLRANPSLTTDPAAPFTIDELEDHTLDRAFVHARQSLTDSIALISKCYWGPMRWRISSALRDQDLRSSPDELIAFIKKNLEPLLPVAR